MKEPDDWLRRLASWQVDANVPRDFRQGVWSRINREPVSLWWQLERYFGEPVRRPRLAAAYAVVAFAAALLGAQRHAASVNATRLEKAELAFISSISPMLQVNRDESFLTHRHRDL